MGGVISSPAVDVVTRLFARARARGASDLHLDPGEDGVQVVLRRDGVLERGEVLATELGPQVVGRLKALADLLAYRTDVPQEGRIAAERTGVGCEVRVATYPTLLGERVAIRFDAPDGVPRSLDTLGLSGPRRHDFRDGRSPQHLFCTGIVFDEESNCGQVVGEKTTPGSSNVRISVAALWAIRTAEKRS